MRKLDIIIPIILIALGLICLTTSGSLMFDQKLGIYVKTFANLCMWMAIPIIIGALLYLIFFRKRR